MNENNNNNSNKNNIHDNNDIKIININDILYNDMNQR